jgi:hypothetical protein
MKFKALKSFASAFGTFDADEEYDVKLDKPTSKMWIEHGLIEEVKNAPIQEAVTTDENK